MALKQAARLTRRHGSQAGNERGAGCAVRARRPQAALHNGWAPPASVPHRAGFVVQVSAARRAPPGAPRAPPGARRLLRRAPRGSLGQVLLLRARHGHRLSAAARSVQQDACAAAQSAADRALLAQACMGALHSCGREAVVALRTYLRLVDEALVDVRDDAAARNGGLRAQRPLRRAHPGTQGSTACPAVRAPRPSPPTKSANTASGS